MLKIISFLVLASSLTSFAAPLGPDQRATIEKLHRDSSRNFASVESGLRYLLQMERELMAVYQKMDTRVYSANPFEAVLIGSLPALGVFEKNYLEKELKQFEESLIALNCLMRDAQDLLNLMAEDSQMIGSLSADSDESQIGQAIEKVSHQIKTIKKLNTKFLKLDQETFSH